MGAYVPNELKQRKLWCVWKREPDERTGKIKKPCYSADPKYNGQISKTQLWQWHSYDDATTKYEYSGEYDGIGFLFHDKGEYVLIDLDHCIQDDGEPNAFASEILELFKGTYVEYSPSEQGLHIIVRGYIGGALFIAGKIEAYGRGGTIQYGTVTGNVYDGTEPLYMQDALNEIRRRYNVQKKTEPQPVADQPVTADDEHVLQLLSDDRTNDNAQQFKALYAGRFEPCKNTSAATCRECPLHVQQGRLCFRSQSEADYRLIRVIKAYSHNYEQTARLFRNSGLYRAKATDEYIRRIYEYTPAKAVASPQDARKGQRGINTPTANKNAVRGKYGAYSARDTATDIDEPKQYKRPWRK